MSLYSNANFGGGGIPIKRNRNSSGSGLFNLCQMSLPELKVASLNLGFCAVLILDGHLNALTVEDLEKALEDVLAADASRVIFDCEGLSFTSSAGLRVFLSTVKRMKSRGGTCAFAALTPAVHDIFEMAGFLETMEIHNSRASALDCKILKF